MKLFLVVLALILAGATASLAQRLSDFELSDQNSVVRRFRFPKLKVTALTVADRIGSSQLEPWIRSLYGRYGEEIDIEGIADVSAVPTPLRGMVRQMFRQRLNHPVMLDWSGSVAKQLGYQPSVANIYAIDRTGRVLKRVTGPLNAAAEQELFATIDRACSENRGPAEIRRR